MSAEHGSSHGHDGPPIPPEPQTPMWLPALGAVLFLAVGLWWATRPAPPAAIAQDSAADAGAVAVASAAAPPPPPAARPTPPPMPVGGPGVDAGRALSPEQAAQLQKMLQGIGH